MNPREPQVHSFIIKLWLSEADTATQSVSWHGHITHVPDAKRHYLTRLSDITTFISSYLELQGDEPKLLPRARRWLAWAKFRGRK